MGNHMSNPSLRGKKLRYAELQGIDVSIIGKIGKRAKKSSNFALEIKILSRTSLAPFRTCTYTQVVSKRYAEDI